MAMRKRCNLLEKPLRLRRASLTFSSPKISGQDDLAHRLLNNSPEFMAVLRGPNLVFQLANRACFELVGNRALIGKPFHEALPELGSSGIFEGLDEVFHTGIARMHRTVATSLRRVGEWPPQQLYLESNGVPYFNEDRSVGGVMVYGRDVTSQTLTEQSLRNAQQRSQRTMDQLLMFLNATDEGYYVVDCDGMVTTCNNQFLKMLGFDRHDEITNRHLHDTIHHTRADGRPYPHSECPIYKTARDGKATYVADELFFRRDGSSLAVQYHVYPIWDGKQLQGALCIFRDITQRKRNEAALLESTQRSKSLFEQHSDAIFSVDNRGCILSVNPIAPKLTGYSEWELCQRPVAEYFSHNDNLRIHNLFTNAFNHNLDDRALHGVQAILLAKSGRQIEVEVTSVPILVGMQCVGVYLIMRDVTEGLQQARSIKHLATHDILTGLANRTLLYERLSHAIDHRRHSLIGLLFLDLNRFKVINDSLGHDKGDLLLKILGRRLRAVMREGDTIARLGGDEFVVLVETCESLQNIVDIVEKIQAAVNESFDLDGHQAQVSTSIGAAVFPKDGQDVGTLMRHADLAMYEAKSQGAPHFRFFSAEFNRKAMERMQMESDLRRALAEEIGMIAEIGNWTLFESCRQNQAWQSEGLKPLKIAVNMSANQLKCADFGQTLKCTLDTTGLQPKWLELEITESVLMQNFQASSAMLDSIHKLGVSISIDDFGSGYSSLSYLRKLPIDTLKIGRSFIDDITEDADKAMIVAATITLAHNLGLNVIAQGVTKPEQVTFLEANRCMAAQGYLFSMPLSSSQLRSFLLSQAA